MIIQCVLSMLSVILVGMLLCTLASGRGEEQGFILFDYKVRDYY